jgi:phosphatidylserine decarboxylase
MLDGDLDPNRQRRPMINSVRNRTLGKTAAATLTSEVTRHPEPKRVLVFGIDPQVVDRILDHLMPTDRLVVTSPRTDWNDLLRRRLTSERSLARLVGRVQVLDEDIPAEIESYDHVVIAEPVAGDGADTDKMIEQAREKLVPGGVLSLATRLGPPLPGGAVTEIGRLAQASAVRSETVFANFPPLRVHHLRFGQPPAALAGRIAPAYTPTRVPVTRDMRLDVDGVVAVAAVAGVVLLTKRLFRRPFWLIPAAAAIPVAAFFRDPRRLVPDETAEADAIVSSADGVVLSVDEISDDRFGTSETSWLRIAVFLSVLDVHVNRSPVAGRITAVIDEPGGYADARHPNAEHNNSKYTVLETVHGPVVVAQRSGLIARRIVQRSRPGALLARGEKFGLIRFGSRTDIYLPASAAHATVSEGDRVTGAESIIARWR